jgi:hypothetical protein
LYLEGNHSGRPILHVALANHELVVVRRVQNAALVEGAVYAGINLAMDIADVPTISSTLERLNWETTFLDELSIVLSTGLNAAQEASACNERCGDQIRFIGVHAGSVVVTIQILPVRAVQALLLTDRSTLSAVTPCRLAYVPNSRMRWTCSKICKRRSWIVIV